MNPTSVRQCCQALLLWLALFMVAAQQTAQAVPPLAPTNLKVFFSRATLEKDANGNLITATAPRSGPKVDISGNLHTYVIQWQDNSLDEEGFRVEARAGNAGPFSPLAIEAANTTQSLIFPLNAFTAGNVLQFQVIAWKYNGSKLETSTSAPFSFTMPENNPPTSSAGTFTAPTNLVATTPNDGTIKLTWKDNSTGELYYQIMMRDNVESPGTPKAFSHLTMRYLDTQEQLLQLGLVPGKKYDFQVFATRQPALADPPSFDSLHRSGGTAIVTVTVPNLAAPTGLFGTATREDNVLLQWNDNSFNETGYEILFRPQSSSGGAFTSLGKVSANTRSINVPTAQGASIEWMVRAYYTYRPEGASTDTTINADAANTVQVTTDFPAPTNLTATTSGFASTIDLTWQDNASSEYGYNVYTRPVGGDTWYFARATQANVKKVSVNSRNQSNGSDGKPIFTTLEPNMEHEFVVRAVSSDLTSGPNAVSLDSNVVRATARDGFTSRAYEPIKVNGTFAYQVATSNAGGRTSWSVTNLPPGLTFHETTGVINNTAVITTPGVYVCNMSATFSNGWTANAPLTLRVVPAKQNPVAAQPFANTTVGINAPFLIPLSGKFNDPDGETAVRLATTKGNIDVLLYPSLAPKAVANFLAYVKAGDYNGMAFHRLVENFVVQGGSLRPVGAPRSFVSIPGRPPVENEPGISNLRGTIATAKLGARRSFFQESDGNLLVKDDSYGYVGNPDSGTTDFFLNLSDSNVSNLDNQNGGFTAFGRITDAGMQVVDAIAQLPTGSYQNFNEDDSNYQSSLDKRIILDGSAAAFSDIPMDADEAPADMDINKTVRVTSAVELPVLSYSFTANPFGIVTVVQAGNDIRVTGLAEGTATVTVKATDLDGNIVNQNFTVTVVKGHRAPVITRHPVSAAVLPGAKATLSVTATGTNLTYQWRKDGVNLDGKTGPTLAFTSVQAGDQGSYDVLVTNATTTLTSNAARVDLRAPPAITQHPTGLVAEVGKPLVLQTAATGAPAPTFSWRRGTAAVAGQTKAQLNIAAAKLTDAGIYTATASNAAGKATSNAATVYAVDKTTKLVIAVQNAKATFAAPIAGPNLVYQWRKGATNLPPDGGRYSGTQKATLTITGVTGADSGDYYCDVTTADMGTIVSGIQRLAVVVRPTLINFTFPTAFIGTNYNYQVPYDTVLSNTITAFTITGLPTGLTYNTATGLVSGRPTKAGVFSVRVSGRNAAGASINTITSSITVSPLPAATVGSFVGTIAPSVQLNDNLGGRVDFTITDTTAYTVKMVLGKTTINAAGSLVVGTGLSDVTTLSYQSQLSIPRKGLTPLTLAFEVNPSLGYINGVLTDGTNTTSVTGFRLFWNKDLKPAGFFANTYNIALDTPQSAVGQAALPQGSGYMTLKVDVSGTGTMSGRLADGTIITGSSIVGPLGDVAVFQLLYKNTGSVVGRLDIGDNNIGVGTFKLRVGGNVRWIKGPQTLATERSYKAGFPALDLVVAGTQYYAPGTNTAVMGLPTSTTPNLVDNAVIDFSGGGLDLAALDPDMTLRIAATNAWAFPTNNPAKVRLTSLAPATGAYTGAFDLVDGSIKRTVTFQGLIVPTIPVTPAVAATSTTAAQAEIPARAASGAGYFLLPQLPTASPPTTITNSPILSGKVNLQPVGIMIVTQPTATQTVNPGTAVVLTVAASGQTGLQPLSYQWRKDGASLSGKTTATLNLGAVTESSQGTYVCEVSNGASIVVTNNAVVNVNDPVTSVQASRTPSSSTVAIGSNVTFSVTAQGTTPLNYQWRKDGQLIDGATSATYTISSVQTTDVATYTVVVSNVATPTGVISNGVNLSVGTGVSNVVATRNPASTNLAVGQSVTFSFTADGAPFTSIQWRKDGSPISGATEANYTIDSLNSSHSGSYTVAVSNAASTAVISNAVPLVVTTNVSNVVATVSPSNAVKPGDQVTFSVSAQGSGLSYQWRVNGGAIPGATSSVYVIQSASLADTNVYDVVVTNTSSPDGVASNPINLIVAEPVSNVVAYLDPESGAVASGSPATFSVTADGTGPFTYQWRKNDVDIPGATNSVYEILNTTQADDGSYSVLVGNAVTTGNQRVSSNTLSLDVVP